MNGLPRSITAWLWRIGAENRAVIEMRGLAFVVMSFEALAARNFRKTEMRGGRDFCRDKLLRQAQDYPFTVYRLPFTVYRSSHGGESLKRLDLGC